MRIIEDLKLDYKDVLIRPKRSKLSSRKEVELNREYTFLNSGNKWKGVPIVAANMSGVGTFKIQEELSKFNMLTCIVKHYKRDDWINEYLSKQYCSITVGTNQDSWKKSKRIIEEFDLKWVCIDVANGYSEHFSKFVRQVRKELPKINIIAGNVVTADMTQELILAGADVVKVGIGPGSVCTTRIETGVGYPQLSAVMECADAAHGMGGHVMADGGCTCTGDIAKAFGAGADFVMLGGMFAGHNEGGGRLICRRYKTSEYEFNSITDETIAPIYDDKVFIEFYGMSSAKAINEFHGGLFDYRTAEGKRVEIPYKGNISNTVKNILGGLRSTCSYVGASKLKDLSKCTTFVKCSMQSNEIFKQF